MDEYDPKLDLSKYVRPSVDLLREYDNTKAKVTPEELQENKNKIVKTLNDFKIGISSIKATIGPTVTLYEIVPKAGVKISKIKNLEDDIALSLAAMGIRIIAPIPGKGTIGIEVPNKNRQMVSMRSVISTEKFARDGKGVANCARKNDFQRGLHHRFGKNASLAHGGCDWSRKVGWFECDFEFFALQKASIGIEIRAD